MRSSLLALALAVTSAIASPVDVEERGLERRLDTASHCGQWESVPSPSNLNIIFLTDVFSFPLSTLQSILSAAQ